MATMKIQKRRMQLVGHIHRHPELVAKRLLLWEANHGVRSRGRPAMSYVHSLRVVTGLSDTGEIGGLMADRVLWRKRINTRCQLNWLQMVQFATLQPFYIEVSIVCCNCNNVAALLQPYIFNSIFALVAYSAAAMLQFGCMDVAILVAIVTFQQRCCNFIWSTRYLVAYVAVCNVAAQRCMEVAFIGCN